MQKPFRINSFPEGWTNINTSEHRTKESSEMKDLVITEASENRYRRSCLWQFRDRKICTTRIYLPSAITSEAGRREGKTTKDEEKYWHEGHKWKILAKLSDTEELEKLEKSPSHWQRTSCETGLSNNSYLEMTTFRSGVHHGNTKQPLKMQSTISSESMLSSPWLQETHQNLK